MKIKNTSQYLKSLDKIAEIIENDQISFEDNQSLSYLKKAVSEFEMEEIQKYPVETLLVNNFILNPWFLN